MTTSRTVRTSIIENEAAYQAAIHRRIVSNAQKTWRKNNADTCEAIEAFISSGRHESSHGYTYDDNFVGSLAKAFDTYGKLSEKQCLAVLSSIAKREEKRAVWAKALEEQKARSEFLGVASEKAQATLTVEKKLQIENNASFYGQRNTTDIYLMRDENGNRIVYKTQAYLTLPCPEGETSNWLDKDGQYVRDVVEGDLFKAKFTIKAHQEYKGEKQTIVQRLKIIK
jgi:hypothetical protein